MYNKFLRIAPIVASSFLLCAVATGSGRADTYTFTLTGDYSETFELPSNPTVTYSDPGVYFATVPTGGSLPALHLLEKNPWPK